MRMPTMNRTVEPVASPAAKKKSPLAVNRYYVQRTVALGLLITLLILNLGMCIGGALTSAFWSYGGATSWRFSAAAKLSGMYVVTPALLTIVNSVELIALARGFLSGTAIVVTASVGLVGWITQLSISGYCTWNWLSYAQYPYMNNVSQSTELSSICPWWASPTGPGTTIGLGESSGVYASYILPWLAIPPICVYIAWLVMGAIWLHRSKKAAKQSKTVDEDLAFEEDGMATHAVVDLDQQRSAAARDSSNSKRLPQIVEEAVPAPVESKPRVVSMSGSNSTAPPSYISLDTIGNDWAYDNEKKHSL